MLSCLLWYSAALIFTEGCAENTPDIPVPDVSPVAPAVPLTAALPDSVVEENELPISRATEECCTDPGAIAACWWQDAEADSATCLKNSDCGGTSICNTDIRYNGTKPPNNWGLCECNSNGDCKSGVCTTIDGTKVCGPSYCNGYSVCSCFGGCKEANYGGYDNPDEMCKDVAGACCEGKYPSSPDGSGMGFCSNSCDGTLPVNECDNNPDCASKELTDQYSNDCIDYVCDNHKCVANYINESGACADSLEVNPLFYGTNPRDEANDVLSCFTGVCNSSGRCVSDTSTAEGRACDDDDGSPCTDEKCKSGTCDHDPTTHAGDDFNCDGDACTLDYCDLDGACIVGPAKTCDDVNLCTNPDVCEDNDPDHIVFTCTTTVLADDVDVDPTDTEDCTDLLCKGGIATPTSKDCTGFNPSSLDLQCNSYSCVEGNGPNNCTLSYVPLENAPCTDGDACTIGDHCVVVGSNGECQPTGPLPCNDNKFCTEDSCSAGTCVFTSKLGDPCTDGNPCTLNDTCNALDVCVPTESTDCSALDNSCTMGQCNTSTGACEPNYLAAGTNCDADGDPCTVNDSCDGSGNCVAGSAKICDALDDVCNDGICDPADGLCKKDPTLKEGVPCNADNTECTKPDTCQAGFCTQGAAAICPANDQCNISVCNSISGTCEYQNAALVNIACNLDNDGCTTETCQGAADGLSALTCTPVSTYSCDDGNVCTGNTCTSTGNNTHTCTNPALPNTTTCNADNDGCTKDDHCNGSGTCTAGTTVTAATCESEIYSAHADFDLDCNTATCMSTGNNSYSCSPVPKSPAPAAGMCDADNNGCTLDTCSGNDPVIGAVCGVGSSRDCSAANNPPCLLSACVDGGNGYSSACGTTNATAGTSCNKDSDGCTVNDACNGSGLCTAGAAATCTPSDACKTSTCSSTSNNTYTCNETAVPTCCLATADCIGFGVSCGTSAICNTLGCNGSHACQCTQAAAGTDCSAEVNEATYPKNCYSSACGSGNCTTSMTAIGNVTNNLCSDLFNSSTPTTFNTSGQGYLGSISQAAAEGTTLSKTGSTLCGKNNYKALAANNCKEAGTATDLGSTGNDVVYGFTYQTEAAISRVDYAYLVKAEADFDIALYAKNEISGATACPEGNNPGNDVPGPCAPVTTPVARLGAWKTASGTTGTPIALAYGAPAAGSNRLLVVGIEVEHTTSGLSVSSVSYGGQSGTKVATQSVGSGTYLLADAWVFNESKIAAQTGGTITVTLSGAAVEYTVHAGMYANIDQTTPVAEVKKDGYNAATPNPMTTNDIAAAAGSAVISFTTCGNTDTCTWAAGLTEATDKQGGGPSSAGSAADTLVATAATISCRGTWTTQNRAAQWSIELTPVTTTPASCLNTVDWTCSLPYSGASAVVEETCATANGLAGQTCCDSCTAGASCGYKWCERGYDLAGTACDLCSGTCDDSWEYPEGPYDCTSTKPGGAAYAGYTYKASTIVHPSTKDGAWKNALVYVDGSGGKTGNFYLTVEKVPWVSSPCERVDDDVRITNSTSVGAGGKTYYDTINDRVNSDHSYTSSTCGGYDCTPTWTGNNACHSTSISANQFWPAESYYNIFSASASSTYCVTTSAPASNALDAVVTLYKATGATDICYEPFTYVDCARNNYLSTNEKMEFTAVAGTQYLIGVSRYTGLNRPCLNTSGDSCDFNINIAQGACPTTCVALSSWYSGYAGASAVTVNGTSFPTTYVDATLGTIYDHVITGDTSLAGRSNAFDIGAGWAGKDEVHQLNYTGASAATVYFSGCRYGGSGSYNGRIALYDCRGSLLTSNDDGCGMNGMPAFSYSMNSSNSPYYLVVDGKTSTDNGPFNVAVYLQPTCTDGLKNGTETAIDCGGSCPACGPTCTDSIQNGTETGVDCGGSCPACTCGAGRCKKNADCSGGTPWCDTTTLDASSCGICRAYFVKCNSADPNTQMDVDAEHGKRVYIPMNKGCINMDMTNDTLDFDNIRWHNRTIKIQPEAVSAGTCTYPYTLSWTTKYCAAVGGVETLGATYDMATILSSCSQYGTIRGTQTVDSLWDDIQIPAREYSVNMDVQFQGADSCVFQMVNWYDKNWADPPNPATITCPASPYTDTSGCSGGCYFGPTAPVCTPNPPRK